MTVTINGTTGLITAGATSSGGGGVASNTALGGDALVANTTGATNTAIGNEALKANTTASNNTAVGYQAAYSNTTGTSIEAFGYQALYANTTGANNSAFGFYALQANTTGSSNNAFGRGALAANTTGANNTAFGYPALNSNTTGGNNTAVGVSALASNTTASNNTAVGYQAGYSHTTGTGGNTFLGRLSGYSTTGNDNTFVGNTSGYSMTTGTKNTILGPYNGNQNSLDIRTASNYIVLSDGDGNPKVLVDNNSIFITGGAVSAGGIDVGSSTNPGVAIYGGSAKGIITVQNNNDSNMYMSKASGYSSGIYVKFYVNSSQVGKIETGGSTTSYVTTSDYRLKENVVPMTGALDKVALLKPVTYKWKTTGDSGQGFIAHELAEVCPDAVSGEKDALDKDGKIQPQGIDTSFLVATLVAAIQELKAEVDSLKQQLGK